MWRQAGYLEAMPEARHLLFDHRGHGQSDNPEGLEAHRLSDYVDDVLAVLDGAGVERAALVGYSDGAVVVFRLAAQHPERVSAAIGIGGVSHPDDTFDGRRELARTVRQSTLRSWLQDMSGAETEPAPEWLMANLASTPTEMFALELEGWADEPTECSDFPRILAPTLIICGERENTDGAAELAVKALPNGSHRILPGLGHLESFWRADLTAPIIAEFLRAAALRR